MQAKTEILIIGGGLAGLTAALHLNKVGLNVTLIEKDTYPHHKVCGEYISFESYDFLDRLGLPLHKWNLPAIKKLGVTDIKGNTYRN